MLLTETGLKKIEEAAERSENITLLFLVEIYRMLKLLLEKQNDSSNGSDNGANSTKKGNDKN